MINWKKLIILCVVFIIIILLGGILIIKKINKNSYEIEQISKWEYFNLYKDGKVGVINKNGDIVINPKYNYVQIPNPAKPVFLCESDEQTVVLNEKSEKIFTNFENVSEIQLAELAIDIPYEKSVLRYKENQKFGLINFKGKRIIKAIYDSLENLPYKEGEFLVKKDDKYGVINLKGKVILDTKYDEIKTDMFFEENDNYKNSGYIVGNKEENKIVYKYISYDNKEWNVGKYKELERIVDVQNKDKIYLIYGNDEKYGIIKNNQVIIKNKYDSIKYDKLNNLFITQIDDKYGILDIEGKELIANEYTDLKIEGMYIYAHMGRDEYVFNNKGEKQKNIKYKSAYPIENSEYIITVDSQNRYGVQKQNGESIIKNDYYYLEYISGDYFIASGRDGKNGIINSKEIILPLKYDIIQKLKNTNMIEVYSSETGEMYIYNNDLEKVAYMKSGKIIENSEYIKLYSKNEVKYFSLNGEEKTSKEIFPNNKLYADTKDGKWGFIDKKRKCSCSI